ncbi:Uu.00g050700.m01.CDS01 [Anthostomella pinea]|uniref:Uu.00g050700.m01.CDS01 n=1 Tax=Anthostomella pinea TaxID=933095 RepID=A0AAI8YMM6_9PEZI|nr:Uu.00g050700.m01.CDS01 [Anthostomella pinea]
MQPQDHESTPDRVAGSEPPIPRLFPTRCIHAGLKLSERLDITISAFNTYEKSIKPMDETLRMACEVMRNSLLRDMLPRLDTYRDQLLQARAMTAFDPDDDSANAAPPTRWDQIPAYLERIARVIDRELPSMSPEEASFQVPLKTPFTTPGQDVPSASHIHEPAPTTTTTRQAPKTVKQKKKIKIRVK